MSCLVVRGWCERWETVRLKEKHLCIHQRIRGGSKRTATRGVPVACRRVPKKHVIAGGHRPLQGFYGISRRYCRDTVVAYGWKATLTTAVVFKTHYIPRLYNPPLFYIGWFGVGWQRHCRTCRSLRELDNQGTVFLSFFFLWRSPTAVVVELDHLCEVKNLYSAQGN